MHRSGLKDYGAEQTATGFLAEAALLDWWALGHRGTDASLSLHVPQLSPTKFEISDGMRGNANAEGRRLHWRFVPFPLLSNRAEPAWHNNPE